MPSQHKLRSPHSHSTSRLQLYSAS
uniref:Uncharacterized protein n=1 Tax=Arundo donax TaxID=35708 RepID=A0A0A9AFA1_ARUDO